MIVKNMMIEVNILVRGDPFRLFWATIRQIFSAYLSCFNYWVLCTISFHSGPPKSTQATPRPKT